MPRLTLLFGFLVCLAFLIPHRSHAQTSSKESRADKYCQHQLFDNAISLYQRALRKDAGNEQLKIKLARANFELNRMPEAYLYYSSVINKRYLVKSNDYLNYAIILSSLQNLTASRRWVLKYLQFDPNNEIAQNLLISLPRDTVYPDQGQDITWL
jgi:tetratricopeptide (TPR) repeat protein